MGLFSFLTSRKGSGDNASLRSYPDAGNDTLRGLAYDSAAVSFPPVRGDRPVAGNGPKNLSDLQRVARKRSEALLSTKSSADSSTATPPMVPRLRSKSLGRPNTAPSSAYLAHQRPNSVSRNQSRPDSTHTPPVPLPRSTPGPPYFVGVTGPGDDADVYGVPPPVPPIASHFRNSSGSASSLRSIATSVTASNSRWGPDPVAPFAWSGRSASASAGTNASSPAPSTSGRRYVDILDAQSSIKPSDFRSRLQATGARDYGEDVADRNLGVNGVDLTSPAVVAFYALTGGGPLVYRSDGSAIDVHGNRYAAGNIPTNLATRVQGKDSHELSAIANKRIRTAQFPARSSSLEPSHATGPEAAEDDLAITGVSRLTGEFDGPSTATQRRKSVHGLQLSSTRSGRKAKPRPLSMHPVGHTDFEPASAPDVPRIRHAPSSALADLPPPRVTSPRGSRKGTRAEPWRDEEQGLQQRPLSPEFLPPLPPKDTRPRARSTRSTRSTGSQASSHHKKKKKHRDVPSEASAVSQRPRSLSSSSRKHRKIPQDGSNPLDFGVPSSGEYIPAVPSFGLSPSPPACSDQDLAYQTRCVATSSRPGSSPRMDPTNSPRIPGSPTSQTRSRTGGPWGILDDITEHLPRPRKSWRNESFSSMAASTTATASSNLSSNQSSSVPRPRSRHTADTSLDLDYSLPAAMRQHKLNQSMASDASLDSRMDPGVRIRGKGSSGAISGRHHAGHQVQQGQPENPHAVDGYAASMTESSDDEPYPVVPRRRHEDEDLIFREGDYGRAGGGLPGLPGIPGLLDSSSPVEEEDDPATPTWSSIRAAPGSHKGVASRHPAASVPRPFANAVPMGTPMASPSQPPQSSVAFPNFGFDDDDETSTSSMDSDQDNYLRPGTAGTKPSSTEGASVTATTAMSPSGSRAIADADSAYEQTDSDVDESIKDEMAMKMRKELKHRERVAPRHRMPVSGSTLNYSRDHVARARA